MNNPIKISVIEIDGEKFAIESTLSDEIDGSSEGRVGMVSGANNLKEQIGGLDEVIKKTAGVILKSIGGLAANARPKKIEAEFSVSLSAEAGFFYIAKGTTTGAIKVKMEWQP